MSLFDALTGKPAKEATDLNLARLGALKTEGMGYLDAGKTGAIDALNTAGGYYAPLTAKYGAGTDLYLDSLGVNGADGNARATSAFQTNPGYDFAVNQSLDALDRRAASRGMLASGNNTIDTLNTVHGLANNEYKGWQQNLAGLINPEMQATSGQAGVAGNIAGVYTNDAQNRVNLAGGVATGQNNAQTQGANAQMQGSANALNLGLNLARLGTGFLGTAAGGTATPGAYMMGNTPVTMYR
jgi:hypothetical protein